MATARQANGQVNAGLDDTGAEEVGEKALGMGLGRGGLHRLCPTGAGHPKEGPVREAALLAVGVQGEGCAKPSHLVSKVKEHTDHGEKGHEPTAGTGENAPTPKASASVRVVMDMAWPEAPRA